ncbi:acyltransferase family protein [Entomomonas asaccharolytica]|uniref:Acyltransferase n=1 Tax=Entomomonas asaccharolytica TaxID=2785331 RepID=A0A974NDU9_9GAMM|nr:acyltransferase family protein [Entomomonas asaccharolytica]QQP84627.1 acyltransferase [Entomomonas asaccharolytica]
MTFRKDINGLRAFAVLAVLLFHFHISGFSGGFSGVDVFFVISGYLMTGIIFDRIRKDNFSIIDFYIARAKRIIPALAILCIILMILGHFYLYPDDYRGLLRDVKNSLLFKSNISYGNDSNYFSTPPQENWLLHTWSLSVEWQFYIIYPLIVALLCKYLKEPITKIILIIATLVSFVAANIFIYQDPTSTFFLLPTRAWEMLVGGLVFLLPLSLTSKTRLSLAIVGLLLIIFGFFYITEGTAWPSYLTLIPVLGTIMVLYGNKQLFITNNSVAQFIGKISYSLYLWHWPIAVFLYYCGIINTPFYVIMGIVASFVMASLSYFIVEQFFLRRKNSRRAAVIKYFAVVILLGGVVSPAIASLVKKYRYDELTVKQEQTIPTLVKQCTVIDKEISDCEYGMGQATAILIGDSHAGVLTSTVYLANPQKTIIWARGGCPILDTNFRFKSATETAICQKFTRRIFDRLETGYADLPVIIANRASLYPDPADIGGHFVLLPNINNDNRQKYLQTYRTTFVDTVCKIKQKRPVYIVKPIPEMQYNVVKSLQMQKHFLKTPTDIILPLEDYYKRHEFILSIMMDAQQKCGAQLLDPIPYLCTDGKDCIASEGGIPLYSDDNHLNFKGSKLLTPLFKDIFASP